MYGIFSNRPQAEYKKPPAAFGRPAKLHSKQKLFIIFYSRSAVLWIKIAHLGHNDNRDSVILLAAIHIGLLHRYIHFRDTLLQETVRYHTHTMLLQHPRLAGG